MRRESLEATAFFLLVIISSYDKLPASTMVWESKGNLMKIGRYAAMAILAAGLLTTAEAETIRVGIGHQSMCTDTYSGGIILKELKLIEKYLPKGGKYEGVTFEMEWKDYTSGPPITNMMLANKLDFGVMGDFPLIVNGAKFQETSSLRTLYVAGTGYNLYGSGNSVVVPVKSDTYSFEQLKGKTISVPVGSAAWGMLVKALQDKKILLDSVTIANQSPPVGAANIAQGKVDAHADFCPWSEVMEFRGTGRKVYDGTEAEIPYLHGVVVRKDYAEQYPEIVVAFLKAMVEAGEWVKKDPAHAAEMLEKWTGIEKEVQYLYFGPGGRLTLDPTIKPKWVETLKVDHSMLVKAKMSPPLDFDQWIDDQYIRQAYTEIGLDYEQASAVIFDPKKEVREVKAEIWHAVKGIIKYPSIPEMLKAAGEFQATGQKINTTYVYDQTTGIKLFGKTAFFVKEKNGSVSAFLRKPEATDQAQKDGGEVLDFDTAVSQSMEKQARTGNSVIDRELRQYQG